MKSGQDFNCSCIVNFWGEGGGGGGGGGSSCILE